LDDADKQRCINDDPALQAMGAPGADHTAACHFARPVEVM
jgi:hypothetical protein